MDTLINCPICNGSRVRAVMIEINGVVDETATRPCETCLGDGMVWLTAGGLVPWAARRFPARTAA
jgi:hypothetical protein